MKLKNEQFEIDICDICEDKNPVVNHVSVGTCLVCTREYCNYHKSDSYFDRDWIIYGLDRTTFPFCDECTKKVRLLKPEDWKKMGIEFIGYSAQDTIKKMSTEMLKKSQDEIMSKLTVIFREAIGLSAEVYKDDIERNKRKEVIEKDLKVLEDKKRELETEKSIL